MIDLAFIAEGKLYLKRASEDVRLIENQFTQQAIDRAQRSAERNAWKSQSSQSRMMPSAMLWQQSDAVDPSTRASKVTGVTPGDAGQLLYAIDNQVTGGLFLHNPANNSEQRLFHRKEFHSRDLCRRPGTDEVATSLNHPDGTAHLALTNPEGRQLREITEGDCRDESPSWALDGSRTLIYQSAGVARNPAGLVAAVGPYAISELALERDALDTLLEDGEVDYLSPKRAKDGALWFIRRPYSGRPKTPLAKFLLDFVYFPIGVLVSIIHFFNFFSQTFAQKPLLRTGGATQEKPAATMMLYGKMIEAEKMLKAAGDPETASLVPDTWQLIRRVGEQEQTIAKGVLAFDLSASGDVAFTNGTVVSYRAAGSEEVKKVCSGRLIERVVFLLR